MNARIAKATTLKCPDLIGHLCGAGRFAAGRDSPQSRRNLVVDGAPTAASHLDCCRSVVSAFSLETHTRIRRLFEGIVSASQDDDITCPKERDCDARLAASAAQTEAGEQRYRDADRRRRLHRIRARKLNACG